MQEKDRLAIGEIYHVFSKSIAGFSIFNNDKEFSRMKEIMRFYQVKMSMPIKFSQFMELKGVEKNGFSKYFSSVSREEEKIVQIIAYFFMPTHIHLILKQLVINGISNFMRKVLNCHSRYFNIRHKRKGPLWEGKFKNVLVNTDEQLLHLTRYIHLNATTANIVNKPEEWPHSSYHEYLHAVNGEGQVCDYQNILDVSSGSYKEFVEDRISYQRDLQKIKHLMLD